MTNNFHILKAFPHWWSYSLHFRMDQHSSTATRTIFVPENIQLPPLGLRKSFSFPNKNQQSLASTLIYSSSRNHPMGSLCSTDSQPTNKTTSKMATTTDKQAEVILAGCGAPKRGMGWYHGVQMVEDK